MRRIGNKFIVGIDIGGTKINVVLFRGAKVLHKDRQLTETKNLEAFLKQLENMISSVISPLRRKEFLGIGCGIAGALDLKKGQVLRAPNLAIIDNLKIKDWLSKKFKREVLIDNDARSFLRGEYFWGAGRGYKNLIGVTLGTGVGGGIMIDGRIIYGSSDSAGEIGHMIIDKNQDFETLGGTKGLKNFGFADSLRAYKLAKSGDKKALAAFEKLGDYLGIGLANIINIIDPQAVIIGGGLAEAAEFFLPQVKKTIKKLIISPKAAGQVKILASQLGEDAGAMGAAALFLE